jgi:hypothetical protein
MQLNLTSTYKNLLCSKYLNRGYTPFRTVCRKFLDPHIWYSETAYGSASKAVLRKLAIPSITAEWDLLSEYVYGIIRIRRSGITHTIENERRKVDKDQNMNIATKITYQIINQMINRNIYVYDDYAMKPGSPKPFFIQAAELFGTI